ncbi:MAG: HigA family addiction module antitoxin [Immundisolibacter sp.]|uniref:HigA family addiction module antitoxin n=1 Tax=Immundisolibacter sp. TaxID=1934948 RepID=UPI003EE04CA3
MDRVDFPHPGEILAEEFLVPLKLSQSALARAIRVPARRINEIVLGKRSITADTALRLSRYFGTSPKMWMALQDEYDLRRAAALLGNKLSAVEVRRAA